MADYRQSRRNWTAEVAEGLVDTSNSIFIALMGVTGAGKSSFISLCSNEAVEVGHDLTAHTNKVDVYSFKYNWSTTVYLIDTPGFDDTSRSDTEVLQNLAAFLTKSYVQKVKLNGIIYLHRITDVRMQGSAKRNLMMFKKLCGQDALKNVILATTMWSLVEKEKGAEREAQLLSTPDFWGWMKSQGSTIRRHYGDRRSAVEIIDHFVQQNVPVTLDIQDQMVNQNRDLDQTSAGQELQGELLHARESFQSDLRQVQEEMQAAIKERDALAEEALREIRDQYMGKIGELSKQLQELKISMDKLHESHYPTSRHRAVDEPQNEEDSTSARRWQDASSSTEQFGSSSTSLHATSSPHTLTPISLAENQAVLAAMFGQQKKDEIIEEERRKAKESAANENANTHLELEIAQLREEAAKQKKINEEMKRQFEERLAEAMTPPGEVKQEPIKFKDAVGRKFSFPFHLCAQWQGMEELIKQCFLHVDIIGPHIVEGHYDLIGPDGQIILPQVWETTIQPGWSVTMHMWPMPEPSPLTPSSRPPGHHQSLSGRPTVIVMKSDSPPPPPKSKKPEPAKGMLSWMAGKPPSKSSRASKK